jgi:hypothetical protein
VLEALWARVVEAWDDDKPHAALLEHATRARLLPEIAGRYRKLSGDPAKAPIANRQLDTIVRCATQALLSMKMPRPQGTPLPITLSAFGVCLLLLGWLAYAIWGRH